MTDNTTEKINSSLLLLVYSIVTSKYTEKLVNWLKGLTSYKYNLKCRHWKDDIKKGQKGLFQKTRFTKSCKKCFDGSKTYTVRSFQSLENLYVFPFYRTTGASPAIREEKNLMVFTI